MTKDPESSLKNAPRCVGFILDGNRRWAEKNSLYTHAGHTRGYRKVKEAIQWVKDNNIPNAVVYGLSTENLARDKGEVTNIFNLIRFALSKEEIGYFKRLGARLSFIGDLKLLPDDIVSRIHEVNEESGLSTKGLHVVVAISYGGRAEILDTVKYITRVLSESEICNLSENSFGNVLWTGRVALPDPDLIIRTGGERRLSNFLLWQASYSELFFTDTLWPDFTKEEFEKILKEFSKRKRNHGK